MEQEYVQDSSMLCWHWPYFGYSRIMAQLVQLHIFLLFRSLHPSFMKIKQLVHCHACRSSSWPYDCWGLQYQSVGEISSPFFKRNKWWGRWTKHSCSIRVLVRVVRCILKHAFHGYLDRSLWWPRCNHRSLHLDKCPSPTCFQSSSMLVYLGPTVHTLRWMHSIWQHAEKRYSQACKHVFFLYQGTTLGMYVIKSTITTQQNIILQKPLCQNFILSLFS